ncbi:uncharacterized protein [Chaetodon trifascialis]|uniref:uncharacterized protein n=1 Tax=Chaetodon trifascialis TaxID=109706 RepID=UPI003991239B
MAGLCWMAITLVLLLSVGNSLAGVNQNHLAKIVSEILNRYTPSYIGNSGQRRYPMFSLAVSIPYNSESQKYDISKVTDNGDIVRDEILKCNVYTGTRVVAATVLRWPNVVDQCPNGRVTWPNVLRACGQRSMTWRDVKEQCPEKVSEGRADHAEYRTLQHFNTLVNNLNTNDFLLFYVQSSPCDQRCTNELSRWSILKSINQILKWKNYAVVFSKVFKPRGSKAIPEQNLRGSLERLGTYKGSLGSVGLSNIFRCDGQDEVQCTSCSIGNQVARYCFSDDLQPSSPQGRSDSPSQSGQGDKGKQSTNINQSTGVSTNVDSNTQGGQGGNGSGGGQRR